jgi:hypothetical protein
MSAAYPELRVSRWRIPGERLNRYSPDRTLLGSSVLHLRQYRVSPLPVADKAEVFGLTVG